MQSTELVLYCNYCSNELFSPDAGMICQLTQTKPEFTGKCFNFHRDDKKVLQKRMENEKTSFEFFVFSDYFKGFLSPRQIVKNELIVRKNENPYGFLNFSLLIPIFLLLGDYLKNGYNSITWLLFVFLGIFLLFLYFIYKYPALSKKEFLRINHSGISINGEFIEWKDYLGFTGGQAKVGKEIQYYFSFQAIGGLKDDKVYIKSLNYSTKEIIKMINNCKNG